MKESFLHCKMMRREAVRGIEYYSHLKSKNQLELEAVFQWKASFVRDCDQSFDQKSLVVEYFLIPFRHRNVSWFGIRKEPYFGKLIMLLCYFLT